MSLKRSREDEQKEVEAAAVANCLMLLSQIGKSETVSTDRVFECKTCYKQFHSFQALGGHRASHKRPKLTAGDLQQTPAKPKSHECSICGVEFALGQALGGHMRRHRAAMENNSTSNYNTIDSGVTIISNDSLVPVLEKTNSCKRAWGLDLNLMPYDHNYLKLGW